MMREVIEGDVMIIMLEVDVMSFLGNPFFTYWPERRFDLGEGG